MLRTFYEFVSMNKIEDIVFVLGGGAWKSFSNTFEKEILKMEGLSDILIRIGYVDDEDLPYLYENAHWFVYSSQYEGFGVPPLEAMSCGCPVIVSDNSSLPEVVGDAGLYVKWDSDEDHVKAYEKYYFDEAFRMKMAKMALDRSELFSWEKSANQMIEIINNQYTVSGKDFKKIEDVFRMLILDGKDPKKDKRGSYFDQNMDYRSEFGGKSASGNIYDHMISCLRPARL